MLTNTAALNRGASCSSAPCVNWLNPAFAQPALGTFGNMGVFNVLGPAFFQFDTAITREFRIREGQRAEFRREAFNLTNSTRFNNPGGDLKHSQHLRSDPERAGSANLAA